MIKKLISSLRGNGIKTVIAKSEIDAKNKILSLLPKNSKILTVPSATLDAIGITKELLESNKFKSVNKKIHSLDKSKDKDQIRTLRSSPEVVLGSVQAITENGQILTVSTTGSQLPSYVYGAEKVILVVGTNKIVKDIDDGMKRIYKYALPLENKRSKKVYGDGAGVNKILIINKDLEKGRITVILIKEKLGF